MLVFFFLCSAKEVQIGEHTALLVKENGNLYAVGNKCTHYGAPLSKGNQLKQHTVALVYVQMHAPDYMSM